MQGVAQPIFERAQVRRPMPGIGAKTRAIDDERPGAQARDARHDLIHVATFSTELLRARGQEIIGQRAVMQGEEHVAQELEVDLEQDVPKIRDLADAPQPFDGFRLLGERSDRCERE